MQSKRKLYITGAIDFEAYERFSVALTKLEQMEDTPVSVELASDGGDAHAALAFSTRIRKSTCAIQIKALGNIASAAVLILAAGDHRSMASEAWVMVHEDSCELSGSVSELEREIKQLRRLENQWNKLMSELTKETAETWAKLHKRTTYLSSEQCKTLGLIDEVI